MTDINLNTTSADCLKETTNFGGSIVHNICTGVDSMAPWGSADWVGYSLLFVFLLALAVIVLGFCVFAAVTVLDSL